MVREDGTGGKSKELVATVREDSGHFFAPPWPSPTGEGSGYHLKFFGMWSDLEQLLDRSVDLVTEGSAKSTAYSATQRENRELAKVEQSHNSVSIYAKASFTKQNKTNKTK